jgi:chromosome partitioning protein
MPDPVAVGRKDAPVNDPQPLRRSRAASIFERLRGSKAFSGDQDESETEAAPPPAPAKKGSAPTPRRRPKAASPATPATAEAAADPAEEPAKPAVTKPAVSKPAATAKPAFTKPAVTKPAATAKPAATPKPAAALRPAVATPAQAKEPESDQLDEVEIVEPVEAQDAEVTDVGSPELDSAVGSPQVIDSAETESSRASEEEPRAYTESLPGAEELIPLTQPAVGDDDGDDVGVAQPQVNQGAGVSGLAQRRPLPRTLAIANQKGGVGKTTTAVNLGAALAELGYRVLVIDLDPQGNATTGLGINARNLDASIYDVILHDVPIEDCIEPTSLRNLFVVPATIDLAGAEIELVPTFSRELRLRRATEELGEDFDFILIDCPPSLGLLTVNALAAAGEVVVPIQCEYYALEGLGQLLRNVNLVQTNLNPDLEVSTIILTMYDARTRLAEQVVEEVRSHFGNRVCRSVVPRTVRLSEAPSFGEPIIVFDSSSRGAVAYRELAQEVSGGAPQRVG